MATQIHLDENLIKEAMALNEQIVDIEHLVEIALQEYIQRRKRYKVLELFGTLEYDEDYDYKQQRQIL
ncbi:MAG: type II toxin-antitoxin system VapB family antitoxin [Leptolyngbyaceae bacterium]|nr:type II toxin-antitoxin system VapB family antitoxin [Leptolyngbyaceae bacterium]